MDEAVSAFGDIDGTLTIDPANPDDAKVDMSIPIDSVTVVSEGLRDHLLRPGKDGAEPDFFGPDAGMARFVSTDVDVAPSGTEAEITGNLTLNGVTQPVTIDARFTGAGRSKTLRTEIEGSMRVLFELDFALKSYRR